MDKDISYSIAVFMVIFLAGLALNLLRRHYIFQLLGIAFLFMYTVIRSVYILQVNVDITFREFYISSLPMLMGISACLTSMVLGFWLFPHIRRKFKD